MSRAKEPPFAFVPIDARRSHAKPRRTGLSMVIDDGLPLAYVDSVLALAAPYIDVTTIFDTEALRVGLGTAGPLPR